MRGHSIFRPFLLRHVSKFRSISSSHHIETLISPSKTISSPNSMLTKSFSNVFLISIAPEFQFSANPSLPCRRTFSSSSEGPSNIVFIKSEEEFNSSLGRVQDESLPAIFYFTAVWCGPCRLISPVMEVLSERYPHVTTYKIDIDQEGLGKKLSELNISSVPTLHFFQNGKKTAEIIGADIARLKDTMEKLYRKD